MHIFPRRDCSKVLSKFIERSCEKLKTKQEYKNANDFFLLNNTCKLCNFKKIYIQIKNYLDMSLYERYTLIQIISKFIKKSSTVSVNLKDVFVSGCILILNNWKSIDLLITFAHPG